MNIWLRRNDARDLTTYSKPELQVEPEMEAANLILKFLPEAVRKRVRQKVFHRALRSLKAAKEADYTPDCCRECNKADLPAAWCN